MPKAKKRAKNCENCGEAIVRGAAVCRGCYCVLIELEDAFDPRIAVGNRQPDLQLVQKRVNTLVEQLREEFVDMLPLLYPVSPEDPIRARIKQLVDQDQEVIIWEERLLLMYGIMDELFGFGPIGPLLRDESTENIFCIAGNPIFIEHKGLLRKTACSFENEDHLLTTIERLLLVLKIEMDQESGTVEKLFHNNKMLKASIPPKVKESTLAILSVPKQSRYLGAKSRKK